MEWTTMPNILVTGARGQLGSELRLLAEEGREETFFFTDREMLDIADKEAVEHFCRENAIDIIINCAAYTAVDKAEEDRENAERINHFAVKYLAEAAQAQQIRMVHISTDYVFDGQNYRPYVESDPVLPQGVYGSTKLAGEEAMRAIAPEGSVIIRTSWVYSSFGNNFVKTMLRLGKEREALGVIFDQVGTPTYAGDLAEAVLEILPQIKDQKAEVYHYSNEGVASWYDFAKEIMALSGRECHIDPIETKAYPTPATRPHYSLLNKAKIKEAFGITIPYWKDSLNICLERLGEK